MKDLFIIGCGGFGREVADVVDAVNAAASTWNLVGFADDSPSEADLARVTARGSTVVGGLDSLRSMKPAHFLIGIGSGAVRRRIDSELTALGWSAPELVHPTASMGAEVSLGDGTILCPGVRLTTNITTGRHVHLNLNSTVGHDSTLHDYVTVNPLVAISGNVTLSAESMLGTHSAVLQGLTVGQSAVVGAAALVVRDVPEAMTVKGIPAR